MKKIKVVKELQKNKCERCKEERAKTIFKTKYFCKRCFNLLRGEERKKRMSDKLKGRIDLLDGN